MLLDGGTFNHNFGTDTKQYRVNIRKVEPIPIRTAGGIVWLNMMCDLCMPGIHITGGYINDHINITLISESVLAQKYRWTFHLDDKGKHITIHNASKKREFWAQMIGYLNPFKLVEGGIVTFLVSLTWPPTINGRLNIVMQLITCILIMIIPLVIM